SLVFFDKHMPMPGFYSLAPVLGTCLIILFCTPDTPLTKLLGCRLFVAIGLISYSAYLWHQPVFVLLHHRLNGDFSLVVKVALILLTFILAYISWRFVEQPFRNKKRIGRNAIFVLA